MKHTEHHLTPMRHPARNVVKTTLFLAAVVAAMLAVSFALPDITPYHCDLFTCHNG